MSAIIRTLGDLEEQIMDILWKKHPLSVRDVVLFLQKRRKVAYTTVMTVMTRLNDKGLLHRKRHSSGAYWYGPTKSREAYLAEHSKRAIQRLVTEYGEVAVAQFFAVLQKSQRREFAEWKKKLKKLIADV